MDKKEFLHHSAEAKGRRQTDARSGRSTDGKRGIRFLAALTALLITLGGCSGASSGAASPASSAVPASASPEASEPASAPESEEQPADDTAAEESIQQLLGYVGQSEDLVDAANAEVDALAGIENFSEKARKQAEVSEKLLAGVAELQKQTEAVSCADTKFKTAVQEYFLMTYDSQKALMEMRVFFADYNQFFELVAARPEIKESDSTEKYYKNLASWYKSVKEGYAGIASCPPCVEPQWKKYGEILDLNKTIYEKLHLSEAYQDKLRYVSALNMADRYTTMEELQYKELLTGLQGERDHFSKQGSFSFKLADEIHAYAEMDKAARESYEFTNIYTGKIGLAYDAIDVIYPSLYSSYDAFLVIKTGCMSGTRKILVEAEIEGLTQKYQETFNLNSAYKAIYIKPPALTGELNLTAAKDAQISLTIKEIDGSMIAAKTFPVTIKSKYDFEWYSDEYGVSTKDNILCFMAPESKAVASLKREAIEQISNMTDGKMKSFVGYQSNPWESNFVGTYLQAAGIMRALYESGVRYNMDTFSISGSNQHILLPDDVLEQKNGLCIETSLVVASALQSAGMHPFLVFPPGHAQVAVEIWDGRGQNNAGTGQYFLIETTALSDNWEAAFRQGITSLLDSKGPASGPIRYMNRDGWYEYITRENTYLIDCGDASILGMTPFAN